MRLAEAGYREDRPFGLVVTGEAEFWSDALQRIVGPSFLRTYNARSGDELLDVVRSGRADAAVLDESAEWELDVMKILRMIRRLNEALPVVVVTQRTDRRTLEDALRLTAFSVVARPLEIEEMLRQIQRMMDRLDAMLRNEVEGPGTRD